MTYTAKNARQLRTEAGTDLEKIATELGLIGTDLNANTKTVKGALTADVSGNFAFTWQNPESVAILVTRVIIDVTTAGGTGSSLLDVGVVANATSTAADIIDNLDLNADAVTDHLLVGGAGAGGVHRVAANGGASDWITGKIIDKDASSLVGNYYIDYIKVI